MLCVLFFFSSRRRHTRWPRDWSSDVCSSDLGAHIPPRPMIAASLDFRWWPSKRLRARRNMCAVNEILPIAQSQCAVGLRSEERRVGKGGSSWGGEGHEGKSGGRVGEWKGELN